MRVHQKPKRTSKSIQLRKRNKTMDPKKELPASSGRMTRLVQRLFVARAHMAPHQKEREQGKLILECCAVAGGAVLSMAHLLGCLEDGAKIVKQDGQWHIFAANGNGIKCRDTLEDLLTEIPPLTSSSPVGGNNSKLMSQENENEETNVPVECKTDLCLRMMVHASLDHQHGDLTSSEVLKHLSAFFPRTTIEAAGKLATDGWLPPRADLAFYSSASEVAVCSAVVHGKFLPDNPTQFDYLHAIRAIASRISNNQIFDLADAAMNLPNVERTHGENQA